LEYYLKSGKVFDIWFGALKDRLGTHMSFLFFERSDAQIAPFLTSNDENQKVAFVEKLTIKELARFNLKTYKMLVKYLAQIYKIVPFSEIPDEDGSYLVLRHDIDVSLEPALKMAEIEHEMEVRSTYFVWLSGKGYNPLEGRNVCLMQKLCALGHEIGLHYDTYQYECYGKNDIEALKMEIDILENLLVRKITAISCHDFRGNPYSFLKIPGYINADDPHLRDVYVFESRKLWSVKSLFILLNNHPRRVQLLIHPCHWEGKAHVKTKLDDFLQNLLILLYKIWTIPIRLIHSRETCER
jgi:hypothetical protein